MFFILERVITGRKMGLDRSQAYSIKMCLIGKRLCYLKKGSHTEGFIVCLIGECIEKWVFLELGVFP